MFFLLAPTTAANNLAPETINHIVVAIVLAMAIGFIELVKHGIAYIINKKKDKEENKEDNQYFNGYHPVAQLDMETVKALKEMHSEAIDSFKEVGSCMREVSKIQEKLVDKLDKVEKKVDSFRDEYSEGKRELLNVMSDWRRS